VDKVLVVQTWGIGDMVLTTPLLQALRRHWPQSHVTVIAGSEAAADVIRNSHLCDDVTVTSFRQSSLLTILQFFFTLRGQGFQVAIVASRISPRVAWLLRAVSGLKVIAGDGVQYKSWGYTHWRRTDVTNHKVIENLAILKLLIPHAGDGDVYFHLDEVARMEAARIWRGYGLEGCSVLGIHPGGGASECLDKRLPIELCREIVTHFLDGARNRRVVFYFGPEDVDLLAAFRGSTERVVLLHGLGLRVIGASIARGRVFLSGDTGLGHVAAAVGVPVVTVAGPTDSIHTRPWGQNNYLIRTEKHLGCMPCYETPLYGKCPYTQECMRSVSSHAVNYAINQALML